MSLRRESRGRGPLRPLALLDYLERAPAAEEAGVFPSSLWRHSYIRLSAEQFDRARALLTAVRDLSGV